jgi:hypothetical protein
MPLQLPPVPNLTPNIPQAPTNSSDTLEDFARRIEERLGGAESMKRLISRLIERRRPAGNQS